MEDDSIELLVIAMAHYYNIRQVIPTLPLNMIQNMHPSTISNGSTSMIPLHSHLFTADDSKSIPAELLPIFSHHSITSPPILSFNGSLDG